MPTDHPRLNVVLEKPLYQSLGRMAKKDGVSLSLKARDLIRGALELEEDIYWEKKARVRAKSLHSRKPLTHKQVWR